MWGLTPGHIIVVLIVFLILFGAGKLPAAARGLGQSLRIFKSEMKEMTKDGDSAQDDANHDSKDPETQRELPRGEQSDASSTETSGTTEKKSA